MLPTVNKYGMVDWNVGIFLKKKSKEQTVDHRYRLREHGYLETLKRVEN